MTSNAIRAKKFATNCRREAWLMFLLRFDVFCALSEYTLRPNALYLFHTLFSYRLSRIKLEMFLKFHSVNRARITLQHLNVILTFVLKSQTPLGQSKCSFYSVHQSKRSFYSVHDMKNYINVYWMNVNVLLTKVYPMFIPGYANTEKVSIALISRS